MLVVGLTGGIGCGKTAVANLFAEYGVPVIDSDLIARELVQPGAPALAEIASTFGPEFLTPAGELDRARLREEVFQNPAARRELEGILHPRVRTELQTRVRALEAAYCIAVIPLLLESGMADLVDRVLVVDCSEATQLARVSARDRIPEHQVRAIMAAQATRPERLARADDVITNETDLNHLATEVRALHTRYLALAGE